MENLIDLHTHSVLSKHAYSSITENIEWALKKHLKYLGTSEHQNEELKIGAHAYAFQNLRVIPKQYNTLKTLRGAELNLLENGDINLVGIDPVKHLDYSILSIHSFCYEDQGIDKNTENYLKALDVDYVKILGHIDDGRYPCDYEKIVKKAKENNKLIELNNSSLKAWSNRLNSKNNMSILIELFKKYDLPVLINSDAHICYDVGNYEEVYQLLLETNFPLNKVLNFNEDLIISYFY